MRNVDAPFGDWLRAEIDRKGWIPAALADAMGVRDGTVARWLSGIRKPGPAYCRRIAAALGIDPDVVLARAGHRDLRDQGALYEIIRRKDDEIGRLRDDVDSAYLALEVLPKGFDIAVVGRVPADSIRWVDAFYITYKPLAKR